MQTYLYQIGSPFLKVIWWLDGLHGGCHVAEACLSCTGHCHCCFWAPEISACSGQCSVKDELDLIGGKQHSL